MVRRMLAGRACQKPDENNQLKHPTSFTNIKAMQEMGLPSFGTLIRSHRLKFLQNIVEHAEHHEMFIKAFLVNTFLKISV